MISKMQIDLIKMDLHLSLLQEELKDANRLSDTLGRWHRRALTDYSADAVQIFKQIQFVQREKMRIQNRITAIENIIDQFIRAEKETQKVLEDAYTILHRLEA